MRQLCNLQVGCSRQDWPQEYGRRGYFAQAENKKVSCIAASSYTIQLRNIAKTKGKCPGGICGTNGHLRCKHHKQSKGVAATYVQAQANFWGC